MLPLGPLRAQLINSGYSPSTDMETGDQLTELEEAPPEMLHFSLPIPVNRRGSGKKRLWVVNDIWGISLQGTFLDTIFHGEGPWPLPEGRG